jgi:hypothetical protein
MSEFLDVFIGWDVREPQSFNVFRSSLEHHSSKPLNIIPLMQRALRHQGLYWRAHEMRNGQAWDVISGAPMATEFAITRFLVPHMQKDGWCLFAECDMLALADIAELFALADDRYALMCVPHDYAPMSKRKMDRQAQVPYARKNWSSLCLWNCDHPANKRLTLEMVNTLPGRDLHRFCWLQDDEIGRLPVEWNYLVGEAMPAVRPKIMHYTLGSPELTAPEWLAEAMRLKQLRPSERVA